jgi:type III secretory pathway component EscV
MAYFKIGNNDYSMFTSELKVGVNHNYNAQANAAGNSVVDYINKKRVINVVIIPLNDENMAKLQTDIDAFNVSISFLNPKTKVLETGVNCIIAKYDTEYYTIQETKTMFKALSLTFEEL